MSKLNVHIEKWDDVAARVADVWRRAERGEDVTPSHHVSFASWEALAAVMTPKRLELLAAFIAGRRPALPPWRATLAGTTGGFTTTSKPYWRRA